MLLTWIKDTLQKPTVWLPALLCVFVGACAVTPSFDRQLSNSEACSQHGCQPSSRFETNPPTVDDLLLKLQCEIEQAHERRDVLNHPLSQDAPKLSEQQVRLLDDSSFIVSGTLTADVLRNEGVSPSLSYITPFRKSMTNFTRTLAGQYAGIQHRVYSQQFTFDLDPEKSSKKTSENPCSSLVLSGDLGIAEVIREGLKYSQPSGYVYDVPGPVCADKGRGVIADSARPTFGTTIEFTITYGLNGGPSWSVTHFKGPSSGNTNLVNYSDARKNTLQITFAPAFPGGKSNPPACTSNAVTVKDLQPLLESLQGMATNLKEIVDRLASKSSANGRKPQVGVLSETDSALLESVRNSQKLLIEGLNVASGTLNNQKALVTQEAQQQASAEIVQQAKADAIRAAQNNNTQMLLQNLLNTHP